jgi:ABC-type transporter Mla maintaining outer membrane lipid asymmetry ATPase subunit MlaF
MKDDSNKVFSEKTVSDSIEPSKELIKTLEESLDVTNKVIEHRVKTLINVLTPILEELKKRQPK